MPCFGITDGSSIQIGIRFGAAFLIQAALAIYLMVAITIVQNRARRSAARDRFSSCAADSSVRRGLRPGIPIGHQVHFIMLGLLDWIRYQPDQIKLRAVGMDAKTNLSASKFQGKVSAHCKCSGWVLDLFGTMHQQAKFCLFEGIARMLALSAP